MHASTTPTRLIIALLAVGASPAFIVSPSSSLAAPAALATLDDPNAEQIMANSVKALGGREAIFKIKSLHTVMTMTMQGMDVQMESYWSRDGGRMSKTSMSQGEMSMASDGKVGWMHSPVGYTLLTAAQTDDLNNQASLFMNMLDPQKSMADRKATAENAGKETFADVECWRVHITRPDGKNSDIFYDIASNMPIGGRSVEKKGDKVTTSTMTLGDWKEEQGVKFFHTMKIESVGDATTTIEMHVTQIEINSVDPAVFAMPEEVKKLADARPADATATGAPAKEITFESLTPDQQKTAKEALDGMLKSGDVEKMKMMVKQLEPMLGMIPANDRLPMQYALQEVKKEIAKKGG